MDVACRLMIENYKLFLDGFMPGKEIKSSSLVWENELKEWVGFDFELV